MLKKLAFAGGNSDARNKLVLTMFNNVNIGERTGSGIPLIINATRGEGYIPPTFQDYFNPDYTLVSIYLKKDKKLELKDNNLGIENDKLELKDDNLGIEDKKLGLTDSNFKFYKQDFGISTVIFNLDIRSDLKSNLLDIYNKLQNSVFSNSVIVEELQCSTSSADNYIRILKNNNLIEVVKGEGKGKYKFK